MKNIQIQILSCMLALLCLQSCVKDKCTREITYTNYTPIYQTLDEIRTDIKTEAARELKNPGKIYFYNNYIFINERREGIHIIDNAQPENPVNIAFIAIPGNVDMAIRDNILYADNYIDLLSIDLSDINNPVLVNRSEDIFPHNGIQGNTLLVDYQTEEITETVDCDAAPKNGGVAFDDFALETTDANTGGSVPASGIGGSMARFTLVGDHLYIVDEFDMRVFDVSSAAQPNFKTTINLGWGIETIIPYDHYLFIGTNSGMQIYDNTNLSNPSFVSSVSHMTACDPVFVKDQYAYVTLRSGNSCDGFTDQLDLIDISNINNPWIVKSFPMDNPHGLSIKEDDLYLCEGEFGFKIFDINDPENLDDHLQHHLKDVKSFDVIALPGQQDVVLIIGEDGFYQYDVSDVNNPELISLILKQ